MSGSVQSEKVGNTVAITQQPKGEVIGVCALVFAILGLFTIAIPFVPLALILSTLAIVRQQYGWGASALVITLVTAVLSPTI